MTIENNDQKKENFIKNLSELTSATPDIGLLKISYSGKPILLYRNIPGQAGSVRIIGNFAKNGVLDFEGAKKALEVYHPFVQEAQESIGKHPAIDVISCIGEDDALEIEIINFDNEIFKENKSHPQAQSILDLIASGKLKLVEELYNYDISENKITVGEIKSSQQKYLIDFLASLDTN